jgi:chaperonin GroES
MNIKPLADRVIIKPSQQEEKTKGGLYVPDTAKEKPVIGQVVAVGPGKISDEGKKIVPEEGRGQSPVRKILRHGSHRGR